MNHNYFVATMNTITNDVKVLGEYTVERAKEHLAKYKDDESTLCKVYACNGFLDQDQWQVFDAIETNMQPLEHKYPVIIMENNTATLWSYFKTAEKAQTKLEELNGKEGIKGYSVTDWPDYERRQNAAFLGQCEEVTRSYYWDKLECLPPMRWQRNEGVQSFFMSEFTSGSFTEQLAEHDGKYYAKAVDYCDRSTWIKTEEFNNAPFNERSKEWGE